jgi:hypothetical protein
MELGGERGLTDVGKDQVESRCVFGVPVRLDFYVDFPCFRATGEWDRELLGV